jgi:hypothetical protein
MGVESHVNPLPIAATLSHRTHLWFSLSTFVVIPRR